MPAPCLFSDEVAVALASVRQAQALFLFEGDLSKVQVDRAD